MTMSAIGINLITSVMDCKVPPALEPKKLISNIETALRIAMGSNNVVDK